MKSLFLQSDRNFGFDFPHFFWTFREELYLHLYIYHIYIYNPIPSMYGIFTYIYNENNQMWVNIPYMDGVGIQ